MNSDETLYFDYQATTPVADEVLLKMQPYFSEYFANPHSSDHVLGWKASAAVENAARLVSRLVGADSDEIIFTSGATESNNLALLGLAKRAVLNGSSRKRILLSAIEHKCVLSIGRVLEEQCGYKVEFIPVDQDGHILLTELERKLGDDVLVVSIMAVNNEIGSVQKIADISELIKTNGAVFHCDAAQAPLAIEMENFAYHVDMLSLSGHKMYGPKGIGALYIRRELQSEIEPLIYGGGQQNGLRSGTLPTPLCVGLGAAAEYILSEEAKKKREELGFRRDRFVKLLIALPWNAKLYGSGAESANQHPGNISIGFPGFDAEDILGALQPSLAASTGAACSSGIVEQSHVLKAIGLTAAEARTVLRISLGFETSDEEVGLAVQFFDMALSKLSGSYALCADKLDKNKATNVNIEI